TATRRLPVGAVVAVSQTFALVGVLVVALATGAYHADTGYVGWALVAAVCGVVGLSAFYSALATGTMGVVAPIAATGVVVPVAVGLAQGDRPSALQAAGVVVAVIGVVLASGPELRSGGGGRPLLLALLAAVGFGAVIVCVAKGAQYDTTMTLLVMRMASVALLVAVGLTGRVRMNAGRRDLPLLAAVGAGDVGANAMFAVASTEGLLSVVAVLSSLYPAVTVLLARLVHGERMKRIQDVGVVAAIAGVALIAGG
ncbi:MAG TPA: DMT family transporter, partial [Mycobacteriales bacterium]|nr:DMT family transporter [Mycobacteriales bacterium]